MSYNSASVAGKLFLFFDDALKQFGDTDIWWRGQASSGKDQTLIPSIYRRKDGEFDEQNFTNTFRRRALSRHSKCPQSGDNTGWLFLMQHYGLPTRLLDWSESILVATYFSVNSKPNEPGVLWALAPFSLNENQFDKRMIFEPDGVPVQPFFKHAFMPEAKKYLKIAAILPKEIDPRLMAQFSVFTIHGYNKPLESLPDREKFLMKFEIPVEFKRDLKQFLWDIGIREANIFPDLEHLAKEMYKGEYTFG